MKASLSILALAAAATTLPAAAQFVTVGDAGNPNDQDYSGQAQFGAVATSYAIGTYEVTLNQYTAFLNAVAATDTYALYNTSMASDLNSAGIARANSPGSYTYSVIGSGARPVTYVSFYDAMRYANWLGSGSTETGTYTLLGGTEVPSNGLTVARNGGAQVWIPSENEWYKAAYYDPSVGGPVDDYWLYPTQSDAIPNSRNGSVSDANSGNFYRDDAVANGFNGGLAVTNSTSYSGTQNYLTDAGAFTQADSYYGTFDQGGNVWEWNDTIIGSSRGLRGGSWDYRESYLQAGPRYFDVGPKSEYDYVGFRVATVPEPTAAVSLIFAGGLLLSRRKRPSAL